MSMIVLDFTLTEAKRIEQVSWQIHMQKHRVEWVDTMRTVFDVVIHSLTILSRLVTGYSAGNGH
jgi:hypothetical protein